MDGVECNCFMKAENERNLRQKTAMATVSGLAIGTAILFSGDSKRPTASYIDTQIDHELKFTPQEPTFQLVDLRTGPKLEPKKDIGEWADDQVYELADSMEHKPGVIGEAGKALKKNLRGESIFDGNSDYYSDLKNPDGSIRRIKLVNVQNFGQGNDAPTLSRLEFPGPTVDLKIVIGKDTVLTSDSAKMGLSQIEISLDALKNFSPVVKELFIAEEVLRYKSVDSFLNTYETVTLDKSSSDDERRALAIHALKSNLRTIDIQDNQTGAKYGGASLQKLISPWGDFFVLVDYLKAKDSKLIPPEDAARLDGFNVEAEYFMGFGNVLSKDKDGNYSWVYDTDKIQNAWMVMAARQAYGKYEFKQDGPSQPQKPGGPLIVPQHPQVKPS